MKTVSCLLGFLLVSASSTSYSATPDASTWDYLEATSNLYAKWSIMHGHAAVDRQADKISINIFYGVTPEDSTDKPPAGPLMETIIGNIGADGKIHAVITHLGTDATPEKIEGQLTQRTEKQNWGGKDVQVLYESIVFSESYRLIGLTHRVRQD